MTVIVLSTAMTHSTGAMRLKSAPMMTSTKRSGRSEQEGGNGVYNQAEEGEDVRIDARQSQPSDNAVQQHTACPAECAGPRHRNALTPRPPGREWWSRSGCPFPGFRSE